MRRWSQCNKQLLVGLVGIPLWPLPRQEPSPSTCIFSSSSPPSDLTFTTIISSGIVMWPKLILISSFPEIFLRELELEFLLSSWFPRLRDTVGHVLFSKETSCLEKRGHSSPFSILPKRNISKTQLGVF